MRHYLSLWKHILDYKGRSAREEYRAPLLVTAGLAALTAVCWLIGSLSGSEPLMAAGFGTGVLFTAHVPPMMALTVRRLRDAGKRPVLAVLSCVAGIGTLLVMLICLCSVSASGFSPFGNVNACVYGPPPEYDGYDPQDNVNVEIYGPPEAFFSQTDEEAEPQAEEPAGEGTADES